jgi:hypothetical protein
LAEHSAHAANDLILSGCKNRCIVERHDDGWQAAIKRLNGWLFDRLVSQPGIISGFRAHN